MSLNNSITPLMAVILIFVNLKYQFLLQLLCPHICGDLSYNFSVSKSKRYEWVTESNVIQQYNLLELLNIKENPNKILLH